MVLASALLATIGVVSPASASAPKGVELGASDTEAVATAARSTGLHGVSAYEGTGVPSDVTAYGAQRVPAGHRIQGYSSPTGDVGVQSIIGADGRVRVDPTTSFPASATVLITRTVGGVESLHCTGWMFGASLVLTAGHCVYNQSSGWYTGQLKFYPGANGTTYPYGSCTAATLRSNTGWTTDGNPDADYGGASLNCSVGNTTGWYGAYWTTASLNGTSTTVQGYPGDKAQQQWTHSDQVRESASLRLYYDNDTVGGNSGSSVHTVRASGSSGCSGRCSLAFHAYGVGSNGHNSGPRITESRFNLVVGWR